MDGEYRNHPVVLLKNALICFVMVFILWVAGFRDSKEAFASVTILAAVAWFVSFLLWRRTKVSFEYTEIRYRRDTILSRTEKTIPYSRLASVGVRRSVIDLIVGTTVLVFNVNSNVSSTLPEVELTLDSTRADSIRGELNRMIFGKNDDIDEEAKEETLVNVSYLEILIHSVLSQSTPSLLWGAILLFYSVYGVMNDSGGIVVSIILFCISSVVPIITSILSYCNYRLYRMGDTVTVESGLFSTTRLSFDVFKINSVRIRRPLFARILGLATLEAEVVGLQSGNSDDSVPLLCPLKPISEVRDLMKLLVPEIVFDTEPINQPRCSLVSISFVSVSIIIASMMASLALRILVPCSDEADAAVISILSAILGIAIPMISLGWLFLAYKGRCFDTGLVSFFVTTGSYDVCEQYILFDKIQFSSVVSGPIARHFHLSRIEVNVLSSSGEQKVSSGLFDSETLERVPEEVIERIEDGRYDYHAYERRYSPIGCAFCTLGFRGPLLSGLRCRNAERQGGGLRFRDESDSGGLEPDHSELSRASSCRDGSRRICASDRRGDGRVLQQDGGSRVGSPFDQVDNGGRHNMRHRTDRG